jgi:hypothetical protein
MLRKESDELSDIAAVGFERLRRQTALVCEMRQPARECRRDVRRHVGASLPAATGPVRAGTFLFLHSRHASHPDGRFAPLPLPYRSRSFALY